jgi:hypothetical protein
MKVHVEGKTEFKKFDNFMRQLAGVPHSQIKAALDKEKKAKKRKKANASASGRVSSTAR